MWLKKFGLLKIMIFISIIAEHKDQPDFDINCVDPLNRTGLIAAIENENVELIRILLEAGVKVKVKSANQRIA